MNRCQWCGRVPSGFGMVVLTIKEDEPSQSLCRDCYNEFAANMLGIEDYKDFEKEATFSLFYETNNGRIFLGDSLEVITHYSRR